MHLLDLSHTSHTRARTGIQRVTRALYRELAALQKGLPITWDPHARLWRGLESWEIANLNATSPGTSRGAKWPWPTRLRSKFNRYRGRSPELPIGTGVIMPELFSPAVAQAWPRLKSTGPRIAIFHDAIALKLPELSPKGTVARFPAYLQELLALDGVAAVSEDSRQTLLAYWNWLGVLKQPPVVTIPLGLDFPENSPGAKVASDLPTILCVGSIEGRKNHLMLLQAAEKLWQDGRKFTLHLIGMAHAQTGRSVLQKIATLKSSGASLRYDGAVDETALNQAYAHCTFTVYPSLMEGFGLPVLESLIRGKPCICSGLGAIGESARCGGTVMLSDLTVNNLADAIDRLLRNPAKVTELATAARDRKYRTWLEYTGDLLAWMKSLQ
jgi:glycosyltransferase involved in cell wall biosynthesis